ncbi:membrane protein, putative [Rubellimicrobium mesophilum DSM 19309]|uniref:Membrane protein, putative n=1 Tax=Rubellimicrobium mesophilum DSM 19309 TaxID=442562 RepID=A0A017HU00_9RHOB|nr:DUF2306 domain-containing protein [Rubellimicrobium mesophilum]EYD77815.1 membrane protein, putative [Rubellimicrobium mesophilum DSM 19309]
MTSRTSTLARTGFALVVLFSALIALASLRFLFGVEPPEPVFANRFLPGWFPLHVAAATVALTLGPFQFVRRLRVGVPKVHRWTGRAYAVACLLGGTAGFAMALGASTGPISQAGFALLALGWLGCTAQGWRMALQGRHATAHRDWMIRSFALTFAAVMLRIYLPITQAIGLPFEESYRVIAWACWVPNLLVAEIILARTRPRRRALPA